jgi:hypothetical protein
MERIVSLKPHPDWRLEIAFSDGTRGIVSLKDKLSIDEFGVVRWPNGADLARDALYEQVKAAGEAT